MNRLLVFLTLLSLTVVSTQARQADQVMRHISDYQVDANELIDAALADSAAWNRLAYLTDTFGPRFSGSENLELALDWV
ncbi:MAG: peptidase M28 family protein, partial [Bacteroidetes Order II. Incertae sedis bacterium]|nr:peptidase M28 family protein [Bacteroidetes Order II. bacterium]